MVNELGVIVSLFTELKDIEREISEKYSEWLLVCGKSEAELEDADDPLKPSVMDTEIEDIGELLDKVVETFKKVKEQYPEKQEVLDYLDFLDTVPKQQDLGQKLNHSPSGSVASESVALGRGEQYLKTKIPILIQEVENRFKLVKDQFDAEAYTTENSLQDALKKLESIDRKITEDSTFERLLRELFDFNRVEFDKHEEWRQIQLTYIASLTTSLEESMEDKRVAKAVERKKPSTSYSTFFKKQDPPKFKGDCLEYVEFRKKWASQVSSHSPPDEFEIDLLKRNIPEEGKKKLYEVESMNSAWRLLDNLYRDERLTCQKLKIRLKNLSPKAKEAHEVIIELNDEVSYLVKRLGTLGATKLLYFDNDYLNAIYMHMPSQYQYDWDNFDDEGFDNPWMAFMDFMCDKARFALRKRALVESLKDMDKDKEKKLVKGGKAFESLAVVTEPVEKEKKYQSMKDRFGTCKICPDYHTFLCKKTNSTKASDRFIQCKQFNNMSSKQRAQALEKFSSCARCTSWSHRKTDCRSPVVSCRKEINGSTCGLDHSRLVCGSGVAYACTTKVDVAVGVADTDDIYDESAPVLPYLQDIPVVNGENTADARTYWDCGSNRVLVNDDFAKENDLPMKTTTITMNVAGGDKKRLEAKMYDWKMVDRNGVQYQLWGYGDATIIEADEPVDPSPIRKLFPHIPEAVFQQLQKKRIDILIGLNFNNLFPTGGEGKDCVGNLKVLRTKFGPTGYLLGGTHHDLKPPLPQFSAAAVEMRAARVEIVPEYNINCLDDEISDKLKEVKAARVQIEKELTVEHWESDNLGVEPPRRCRKCLQCAERGDCSDKHIVHTLKEELELKLIEDNVNIVDGKVEVRYQFLKDPATCFKNNRYEVMRIEDKLWNSLKKENLLDAYHAEIRKYIDRGTFIELSKSEMEEYAGPVNYIIHLGVLKDSASTPLRVVTNSSKKNGAYSLNDLMPKGPNSLNDMLAVIVRFRTYVCVFVYDLSKASNTMRTSIQERHRRRFVWKWSEGEPWIDYGIDHSLLKS